MVTLSYILMTLLGFSGLFLIGLILLQRGRGGGLAGAFGGMGGQSAFGTKAGDVFTRITIGVAAAWILLCAGSVLALHHSTIIRFNGADAVEPLKKAPAKGTDEASPVGQNKKDDVKKPEDKKSDDKKAVDKNGAAPAIPAKQEAEKVQDDKVPADESKPKEEAKQKDEAKPDDDAKKPDDVDLPKPKPE